MESKQNSPIGISGAIIIAGAIIAVAIIWAQRPPTQPITTETPSVVKANIITMAAVTNSDHILGNPAAPIKIVEYSDTSCPYCKIFHTTMRNIIDKYGTNGDVAWVYRHFPLHKNSKHEAQATECAAALGGNDGFWKFTNQLYEITESDKGIELDQSKLPQIAESIGLNIISFNECLTSDRFTDKIEKDNVDGLNVGVSGTPTSVFLFKQPLSSKIDPLIQSLSQLRIDKKFA